jgi:antitoxin HigA-1
MTNVRVDRDPVELQVRILQPQVYSTTSSGPRPAAEVLKVRRATLSDLLRGKAALTAEMALRIEKAFGPDMDHLLRMQLAYDVAKTRRQGRSIAVKRYVPPAA